MSENIVTSLPNHNIAMVYDPSVSGYKGLDWSKLNAIQEKIDSVASILNAPPYQDFSGYFNPALNSTVTFQNSGFNTIAFHINNIVSGQTQFQGEFGENFTPITFRQIGNDGYAQFVHSGTSSEDYIGSISAVRSVRLKVTQSGRSITSGYIAGRMSRELSVLEGIEHTNPPHKFGNELFHRGFILTNSAVTDSGIVGIKEGFKIVLTYLTFGINSSAGTNVTIHEGTGTANDTNSWAFSSYVRTNPNESQFFNVILSTPFVSATAGKQISLTCDDNATIRGAVHGYYSEN